MQLIETWENRPIINELSDDTPIMGSKLINEICKRRSNLTRMCDILNITDTSPQYDEHYVNTANIVIDAIKAGKPIIIAGDYDVDGMTATATLYKCITSIRSNDVLWWIPSREDGYGINYEKVMELVQANNYQQGALIITVDNGIAAAEEIAKFPENIKVIVTDHHLAEGKELPKCEYILDPKVFAKEEDDEYMMSGCFVAAKLGLTICKLMNHKDYDLISFCEIAVCLSILSDMIPLNWTARCMMRLGMISFNRCVHPGLRALMTLSGFKYGSDITTNFLSFILIPKINAAGRMNRVDLGMQLLLDTEDTSDNGKDSILLANDLINCNRSRKTIEDIIFKEAFELIELLYRKDENTLPSAIVVHKADWLAGVIGIVAARLTDLFKVPVICLTGTDVLHGSGRAPTGYDLYGGLEACKDTLIQFGGHRVAGGLSLEASKLDEFRKKFSEVYASQTDNTYPRLYDSTATIQEIKDVRFQLFIKQAEPFGVLNDPLAIRLNHVYVANTFTKGESICLILRDNTDSVLVSKYKPDDDWYKINIGDTIDIIITPNLVYFTGTTIPEYKGVSFKSVTPDIDIPANARIYTNEEAYKTHISR